MAEKKTETKERKKAKVSSNYGQATTQNKIELLALTKKNATPYRVASIILWLLGLTCEVFAILFFTVKIDWSVLYENPGFTIAWAVALGLDLIFVVIGSLLWKKANHIDPASAKQPVRFWLHNNLGIIVAAVAFIPFIIFALTDKNASKKNKTIAAIAAGIALIIGILFGIDYNPVSQEEMLEAYGVEGTVFYSESGTVYHVFVDCQHISSSEVEPGSIARAEELGKTRVCKTCEKRLERENITIEEQMASNEIYNPNSPNYNSDNNKVPEVGKTENTGDTDPDDGSKDNTENK